MPPRTANSPRLSTISTRAYADSTSRAITSSGSASSPARSRTGSRSPSPATIGCSTARTGATTTLSGPPSASLARAAGWAEPAQHGEPLARPCPSAATAARAAASPSRGSGRPCPAAGTRRSAAVRSSASRAVAVTASTNRPGTRRRRRPPARRDEQRPQRGRARRGHARRPACQDGWRGRYGAGDLRLRRRVVRRGSCCPNVEVSGDVQHYVPAGRSPAQPGGRGTRNG